MVLQRSLFQKVFDACSLINLKDKGEMSLLRRQREEILIPRKVADELKQGNINDPLRRFVKRFPETIASFRSNEEDEYLRVRGQAGIGDGEAAAITIAFKRNLPLVIDDNRGREKAKNHGIKTLSWKDLISGG